MRSILLACLLLLGLALAHGQSYEEVHQECGRTCANEHGGSGTCEFDTCRLCCEKTDIPSHYEELCAESSGEYFVDGGGHCEESPNACDEDVCAGIQLLVRGSMLAFY